ncbi:MAG: thioredoxin domain-containing protein [Methylococcus sp.]|nr:MAG: thioredoxin domain-containing protein [Methylococcus sp.]
MNHLQNETSPYLQQHAANPVQWYPWGEQALELARRENKPILLSIGYSACHWCHVMAHESFEDQDTARVMNELYVNIKVDREERPDIDKIYQLAHQLLTQRPGGWPLNMFLTPHEHIPFFGGTYFPPYARYNMSPFKSILRQTADYYREQQDSIRQHNTSFLETLRSIDSLHGTSSLDPALLEQAASEMLEHFDPIGGGFGQAPKFPHCSSLEFMLGHWFSNGRTNSALIDAVMVSLTKMAEGGIQDQVGGGFCRYSVDDRWNIPHFEKMLYDNGALLLLYTHAWQITEKPLFRQTVLGIAEWVMSDMQSPAGGFYSSRDADSEGEEGRFYVWNHEQLKKLLDSAELDIVRTHFGLDRPANFEGHWHLYIAEPLEHCCEKLNMSKDRATALLASARQKLQSARSLRIHPSRDDKILTSWNALIIKGLAIAGRVFGKADLIASARRAFEFLVSEMWVDGRLLATHKDGHSHLNAYLDDYAYLIDAALELSQSEWQTSDLVFARQLADVLLEQFEDKSCGGFFFTSDDHEKLIHRPKPLADESMASGNGVAAYSMARLGHVLGEPGYIEAARRVYQAGATSIAKFPSAHSALLTGLQGFFQPSRIAVIRGPESSEWAKHIASDYYPDLIVLNIPVDENELPGILAERNVESETVAYVCTGSSCLPTCRSLEALVAALEQ